MRRGFIQERIFSAQIDPKRWLIIELKGRCNWNLLIIGPEPLNTELVELPVREAMDQALRMAKDHFRKMNPRVMIAPLQRWREALFVEQIAT